MYSLTEAQVNSILELRLQKLTALVLMKLKLRLKNYKLIIGFKKIYPLKNYLKLLVMN